MNKNLKQEEIMSQGNENSWNYKVLIPFVLMIMITIVATLITNSTRKERKVTVKTLENTINELKKTIEKKEKEWADSLIIVKNTNIKTTDSLIIVIAKKEKTIKRKEDKLILSNLFLEIGFRMIPNSIIEEKIKSIEIKDGQINFMQRSSERWEHLLVSTYDETAQKIKIDEYRDVQNFLKKILSNPKNINIFWKAKRNIIMSALAKHKKGKEIVKIFQKSLAPNEKISDIYQKIIEKKSKYASKDYEEWESLYKLKNVGDIGLTTTIIRYKNELREKTWQRIKKSLNEKANFVLQNLQEEKR